MKRLSSALVFAMLFLLFPQWCWAFNIERRKDQFYKELAYMVYPLPYSLPGIGSGVVLTGYGGNIFGTYMDADALIILGDAQGTKFDLNDIHLIHEKLIVDMGRMDITKVAIRNYQKRGMKTDKEDFNILEMSGGVNNLGKMTLTFLERRLEFFLRASLWSSQIDAIDDSEGESITELTDPIKNDMKSYEFGVVVDYTDDHLDPRKGFRIEGSLINSPRVDKDDPDYYKIDYSLSLYVPVGKLSTWGFNYFRSRAHVVDEGETDVATIKADLGYDCDPSDTECNDAWNDQTQVTLAGNRYGDATDLGGENRLRAFPMGRFKGAHSEYLGTELRWNLTEEFVPFDYWIWKDVRTGVQVAAFAETGTVADREGDLWKESRQSYGLGIRMITGSGIVYRLDISQGEEGISPSLIFNYPW